MVVVRQVVQAVESLYPLSFAEEWDAPGLIVGERDAPVRSIVCAVDPTMDVVGAAIDAGADMLVCHHPLYFRPVHAVSSLDVHGAIVGELYRHGCALWVGHTNADVAHRGVAQAAADLFGLDRQRPLVPTGQDGDGREIGLGRVGVLGRPMALRDFAHRVAEILPATALGVQVSGELDAPVRTVAVLPGSGDGLFEAVRAADVDVYVTSDLRHHPATDAIERARHERSRGFDRSQGGRGKPRLALINTPHAAIESLWLGYAVEDVPRAIEAMTGEKVSMSQVDITTDPWDLSIAGGARRR